MLVQIDSEIADVKTIGNNQLLVIGVGKGKTSLVVWTTAKAEPRQLQWELTVNE